MTHPIIPRLKQCSMANIGLLPANFDFSYLGNPEKSKCWRQSKVCKTNFHILICRVNFCAVLGRGTNLLLLFTECGLLNTIC